MTKARTEIDLLTEISRKLDAALGFLATSAVEKDPDAVIRKLRDGGHATDVIARVVGISENAVAIRLTRMKKKSGKSTKKANPIAKEARSDKSRTEEGAAG